MMWSYLRKIVMLIKSPRDLVIDNNAFSNLGKKMKVIIRAKNLKQYNKIVKKIKNAGGEKLTFKFRKRSVF